MWCRYFNILTASNPGDCLWRLCLLVNIHTLKILHLHTFFILQARSKIVLVHTTNKVKLIHSFYLLLLFMPCFLWLLGQVLLFFKFYDPLRNLILYMGHSVEPISKKFGMCLLWFMSTEYFILLVLFISGPVSYHAWEGWTGYDHPTSRVWGEPSLLLISRCVLDSLADFLRKWSHVWWRESTQTYNLVMWVLRSINKEYYTYLLFSWC